jgi:hypothetical protein
MDRRMVETFDQPDPRIPLRESVLFMLVLALCTFGPWTLHFAVAWWAGLIAIPVVFAIYSALFVPRGSICMGIPFVVPLGSALLFIAFEVVLFAVWVMATLGGESSGRFLRPSPEFLANSATTAKPTW